MKFLFALLLVALLSIVQINAGCYNQRVHIRTSTRHIRCRNGYALRALHRNRVDNLSGITHIQCCSLNGGGRVYNHRSNWVRSFDVRGWSTCPAGYFVNGFYKSNGNWLYNIEFGYCQRKRNTRAANCYTETQPVGGLDRPGWAYCRRGGYLINGFWRNVRNNHHLHRLEYFRCCRQISGRRPAVRRLCYSNGDPHYMTFYRNRFDNMWTGTFLLAKTRNFLVHTKTGVWNRRTSVNIATGVKVNNLRLVFKNRYNNVVKVNGRNYRLRNGRNNIRGVRIDKHGSRIFVRKGGEYVSVQVNFNRGWRRYGQTQYQNVAVFGVPKNVGICGNKGVHRATGIFGHSTGKVKVIAVSHCTKKQVAHAKAKCGRRFRNKRGRLFQWCVFDVCRGLRAKWAANFARQIKYWQNVVKRYNQYRKNHLRIAKAFYRKKLKHLQHMRVHGRHYRNHVRARNANLRARNAHIRARNAHYRARNSHYRARNAHARQSRKYHSLYLKFKRLANHWGKRARYAQQQINKCRAHIRNQKKKKYHAARLARIFANRARNYANARNAHRRAANAHHRAAINHSRAAANHQRAANIYHKRANAHHRAAVSHLNARNRHARWASINHRRSVAHKNASRYWANRVKNVARHIRNLVKRRQAQFRKEVRVVKTIRVRSRRCKSTPKYLDGVKYFTSRQARSRALRRCRHRDRRVWYSCVYDHSKGIFHTKREYARLAALERRNRQRKTCYSWGDPHMKRFDGHRFNVYHQTGWRNILTKGSFSVRGYLTYTPTWGRRSINRYLLVKVGRQTAVFYPWGRTRHCSGFRRVRNHGHYKEWRRNVAGYNLRITWHRSRSGGYWSVWISTTLGRVRGCSGYCCSAHTRKRRGGRGLKRGNPYSVRFGNKCQRKTTAFRICAYAYRRFRRRRGLFRRLVRNCVNGRRHL